MTGIPWQVFTLVRPGLINQREKTRGAACTDPGGHEEGGNGRKVRGSKLAACLRITADVASNIQVRKMPKT